MNLLVFWVGGGSEGGKRGKGRKEIKGTRYALFMTIPNYCQ